jgi:hypothetical protein
VCGRVPTLVMMVSSAAKAASMRATSWRARYRSAFNCSITADMFVIGTPAWMMTKHHFLHTHT